jgi:uncharacterized protein (TIGR01619 family)
MSERWGSYFCNVNDQLASIALNLDLISDAPIAAKPWLLWVWVYLRSPRADGLSDRAEFDTLCAVEDELVKAVAKACGAIEAGRITTDGHREFYFYGATDKGFDSAVTLSLELFGQYKFDLGSQHDPEWSQYHNVLYPSDEETEKMKNQDVLNVLREHGDTLQAVRDVHHWIYCRSNRDRQWLISEVKQLGYTIEEELDNVQGRHPFGLQITRDQSVIPNEIDVAVIQLFRLARQVDAEYDGWEAQVISTTN